jgi:hypothetical protein
MLSDRIIESEIEARKDGTLYTPSSLTEYFARARSI